MSAKVVAVTAPRVEGVRTADELIAYVARVSNPVNQLNSATADRLIGYCYEHGHLSIFETATMTVEIETSRAIAAQILRHRSFTFQEFSQRYSVVETDPEIQDARSPDPKNRQASHDTLSEATKAWWADEQRKLYDASTELYLKALEHGIAKECARFVLPLATPTRLYVTGNVRSWIHYIDARTTPATQKEHRDVALAVKNVFVREFPMVSKAMGWVPEMTPP